MALTGPPNALADSETPSAASKRLLPWLVAVAFFMESLDTTILNTAVPAISAALHVVPLSMKAVLASYTLSLAVFIPISGWVADRFGTRRVFAAAIGLFTLGSLLCGISSNIHVLVACRILQGCGGSMMVPVGRLTLVRTFAKSDLLRTMSFVSIPALVAPMLGPIAGGLIVGYLHWRVIFFLNIPIGLIGLMMVYLHLPDYREKTHPLDTVGLILFGSGIALLSYVLEVFGEHTLSVREILGLLALSLALLAGYWLHAKSLAFPLLQLGLFKIRTFRAAVNGSFFTRLGIGGVPFLLPLLYQVGLGFHSGAVGPAHHAAGSGRHEHEGVHAPHSVNHRLSLGAHLQHRHHRSCCFCCSPPSVSTRRCGSLCCRHFSMGRLHLCSTPA
jgi:EmrB/QacA subfamily drug resistance transporter